jgi:EAL domain-containing protein (putative c-di-GMP-specific phosphodiesterase class I)
MTLSRADAYELLDPRRLVQRVADQALELVRGAGGVLIGLSDGRGVTYVCGSGYLRAHVGTSIVIDASLSGLAVRTGTVLRSDDTETDPRVDLQACRRLGVASSVCVPLCRADQTLGVMAVSAQRAFAFSDADVALLARLADFLGVAVGLAGDLARVSADLARFSPRPPGDGPSPLSAPGPAPDSASRFVMNVLRPDAVSWMEARARVQAVLDDPGAMSVMFQPIVDLATDRVVAVEALARFQAGPRQAPDVWFAEAHEAGLGVELEMLAVAKALAQQPALPDDVDLTVNVGPEAIVCPQLAEALSGPVRERVVLELTEHSAVEDYPQLLASVLALRQAGVRLSVDDAGAGFSSLCHILKLAPDFIKLDRDLVAGVDIDPVRRALTSSLVSFAADTGAQVVAEGVETGDELEAVRRLGARYAQGYHLGRPAPLASMFGAVEVDA